MNTRTVDTGSTGQTMNQGTSPYFGRDVERVLIVAASECTGIAGELQGMLSPMAREPVQVHALTPDLDPALLEVASGEGETVVVSIDFRHSQAAERLNLLLARRHIPCLFNTISDAGLQVGPWTYYGHTPCWQCDRTSSAFFRTRRGAPGTTAEYRDADMAATIAAALSRIFDGSSDLIEGMVASHAFGTGEDRLSRSLKDPLCTVCSIWSRQPTEQFYVQ